MFGDLFICAKDLLFEAKAPTGPVTFEPGAGNRRPTAVGAALKMSKSSMSDEFENLDPFEKAAVHKLDRLIDEMRFLKSRTIAFDTRLRAIEAYLKPSEPSEQQPGSKLTPWLAAAASTTARTALFAIGAAVGATLTKLYLGI